VLLVFCEWLGDLLLLLLLLPVQARQVMTLFEWSCVTNSCCIPAVLHACCCGSLQASAAGSWQWKATLLMVKWLQCN
jgi:hypothetical protein